MSDNAEDKIPSTPVEPVTLSAPPPSKRGGRILFLLLVILGLVWFLVRPGVFTIQPLGALPDGITFIYHSRNPDMPFFSSPDGLCLLTQGEVTILCRLAGLAAVEELSDRIMFRLPYSRWAYLQSTDGQEFDR